MVDISKAGVNMVEFIMVNFNEINANMVDITMVAEIKIKVITMAEVVTGWSKGGDRVVRRWIRDGCRVVTE